MKLVVIIVAASVCVNLHYCEAEDKSSRQVRSTALVRFQVTTLLIFETGKNIKIA